MLLGQFADQPFSDIAANFFDFRIQALKLFREDWLMFGENRVQ